MGLFYVILGVVTLAMNFAQLPEAFKLIFWCAFNPEAAVGGAFGYTMMLAIRYGFARGVFSNEAGLGSILRYIHYLYHHWSGCSIFRYVELRPAGYCINHRCIRELYRCNG